MYIMLLQKDTLCKQLPIESKSRNVFPKEILNKILILKSNIKQMHFQRTIKLSFHSRTKQFLTTHLFPSLCVNSFFYILSTNIVTTQNNVKYFDSDLKFHLKLRIEIVFIGNCIAQNQYDFKFLSARKKSKKYQKTCSFQTRNTSLHCKYLAKTVFRT